MVLDQWPFLQLDWHLYHWVATHYSKITKFSFWLLVQKTFSGLCMYVVKSLLDTERLKYQCKIPFGNNNTNNKYKKLRTAEYIHRELKVDNRVLNLLHGCDVGNNLSKEDPWSPLLYHLCNFHCYYVVWISRGIYLTKYKEYLQPKTWNCRLWYTTMITADYITNILSCFYVS